MRLAAAASSLLGGTVLRAEPLAGGDLSEVIRLRLADGRDAVAKSGPAPRVEAAMLRAIAAAGAPAPPVLGADDAVLVLGFVAGGDGLAGAWESLGAALATLHRTCGDRYGWPDDYAFGRLAIDNRAADDWPSFWADRRLRTHLPHVPPELGRRIEALAAGLGDRLPERPAPALLHGDLWGGNVIVDGSRIAALIDPAAFHGHAEADFAMLELFDRPPARIYAAYGASEPGRPERLPVYQLWPALVHLRLFGAGYRAMVERLLAACGV